MEPIMQLGAGAGICKFMGIFPIEKKDNEIAFARGIIACLGTMLYTRVIVLACQSTFLGGRVVKGAIQTTAMVSGIGTMLIQKENASQYQMVKLAAATAEMISLIGAAIAIYHTSEKWKVHFAQIAQMPYLATLSVVVVRILRGDVQKKTKIPAPGCLEELNSKRLCKTFIERPDLSKEIEDFLRLDANNNNVLLKGASHVGKKELVYHLASKIERNQLERFEDFRVFKLNALSLYSKQFGSFIRNVQELLEFFEKDPKVIVVIENIDQIIGMREYTTNPSLDQLLHTPLKNRNIRFIGTAHYGAGMQKIEKTPALLSCFQQVTVPEMTTEERKQALLKYFEENKVNFPADLEERVIAHNQALGKRSCAEDILCASKLSLALAKTPHLDVDAYLRELQESSMTSRDGGDMPSFMNDLSGIKQNVGYIENADVLSQVLIVLDAEDDANNLILVGAAGCGKTALIEDLAWKIRSGNLKGYEGVRVFSTSAGKIMANQSTVGTMEGRVEEMLNFLETQGNVILFIDEIHHLIGAGAHSRSTHDVASHLLTGVLNSKIRIIGATTPEDCPVLRKNPAFVSRFAQIAVPPMTSKLREEIVLTALKNNGLSQNLADSLSADFSTRRLKRVIALTASALRRSNSQEEALALAMKIESANPIL